VSEQSKTPDLVDRARNIWAGVDRGDWAALVSVLACDAVWDTKRLGMLRDGKG
jgi:hypothetical protein